MHVLSNNHDKLTENKYKSTKTGAHDFRSYATRRYYDILILWSIIYTPCAVTMIITTCENSRRNVAGHVGTGSCGFSAIWKIYLKKKNVTIIKVIMYA